MTAQEANAAPAVQGARRARWLKNLHQWHWISAALSLLCMVMFSLTGITLNHAAQIEAKPQVVNRQASLPPAALAVLAQFGAGHDGAKAPLPAPARAWLAATWAIDAEGKEGEWTADEVYLPLPRPGGDAWVRIGLKNGHAEYELTTRGVISLLNDLHKGRNTGAAWNWFIDAFAVACLLFALTGLLILKFHARTRVSTWPVVGLGVLLPVVLALLYLH